MRTILIAIVACLAACGPATSDAPSAPTISSSLSDQLSELGFYGSRSGHLTKVEFRDYPSGSTHRDLPQADFANVPVLGADDALILFGELPEGTMDTGVNVFRYEENGSVFSSTRSETSVESFFSRTPLDPVRGTPVTRFAPTDAAENGLYFLHRYVGMNGDAYLAFRVER